MSKFYEAVWPSLSAIYKRPKNFTDHCDTENVNINLIPITYCPTICVRMWEEAVVAGKLFSMIFPYNILIEIDHLVLYFCISIL